MGLVKGNAPGDSHPGDAPSRSFSDLLIDLDSSEPGVRRTAARELAHHPAAALSLCDRLDVEAGPSVRAVIFSALVKLQSPAVAIRLSALLSSDDVPLRNAAIEALQAMPDAVAPHIKTLLGDPDSDVRIFAVNILGALCHDRAPEWLMEVVRVETHVNVCAAAVDALAEVGTLDAVTDLETLRARFDGQAFMTFAIDTAIRRIQGQ